jgi:phosphate transport system protein
MRTRFEEQLKELNIKILQIAGYVEQSIFKANNALIDRNVELAREVIENDNVVDELEKEIESKCLKLILHQQPVATDLRRISSALKIITDLERIADQAADIAEITIHLAEKEYIKKLEHIPLMAKAATSMVTESINAYINDDIDLAKTVINADDCVDEYFRQIRDELVELITHNRDFADQVIDFLMIAKYLERIGDHAVNIAEWAIFTMTGMHKSSKII